MSMKKFSKPRSAFTLVELIVAITILAILGTIAFLSMGGHSSRARDSTRVTDVAQLSKSLDLSIIHAGSYPMPDGYFTVTYSGGAIWHQGSVGKNVIQQLHSSISGGGLDGKPTDPLKNTDYAYSTLAFGKAYQVKVDYEGDLAHSNIIQTTYAAPGNPTVAFVRGNYGGIAAKTQTGNVTYVLAVPSIVTGSGITAGATLEICPSTLSGTLLLNGRNLVGGSSFNPCSVVHSGAITQQNPIGLPVNDASSGITNLASNLKSAYVSSDIASYGAIQQLVATATGSIAQFGASLIMGQLGGSISSTTGSSISDWRNVDPNCTKPDVTIGSQTWAGCNSTVGSIAINYNSGPCYDYNGTDVGGSVCYGTTTKENWSGISTSANGYSAGIPGISDNIYGALYQWDTMNSNSCFGTNITSANCPCKSGYHVPTQAEWDALEVALGCTSKLTGDTRGWECTTTTTDTVNGLGWTSNNASSLHKQLALPLAGLCSGGTCDNRGSLAYYWSASVYAPSPTTSWSRRLAYTLASVVRNTNTPTSAFSVRCLKD